MKNYTSNVSIALKNELLKKNINILFNSTVTKINKTNIEINGSKN